MLPTDLENYLIKCRNQHTSFDAVAGSLTAAGWSADMILSAKNWYLGNTEPVKSEPSSKINNTRFFSTPASTDHYPRNRLHPAIWVILFLGLSIISFLILSTFQL